MLSMISKLRVAMCSNSKRIWVKRSTRMLNTSISPELSFLLSLDERSLIQQAKGKKERDGEKEREIRIDYLFHKPNIKCWTQSPTGTLIKQRAIFIDSPLIPVPTTHRKNDNSLFLLGRALKGPQGKTFHRFNWSRRSLIKGTVLNCSTKGRPFRASVKIWLIM